MLRWIVLVVVLGIVLAGCSFIPGGGASSGGTVVYNGATESGVRPGETIPNTDIRFVAKTDDGAQVIYDDRPAIKKMGDSLDWKGTVAPGVEVSMPQRIALITDDRLQTVGTVRVIIEGVNPVPGIVPTDGRYVYKLGSGYTVKKGERVPGTTLTFMGKTDEGARFDGMSDYPYRRVGDSVSWKGQLAPGVYLDTTLRVGAYTDEIVTLLGTASITVQ